jgi:putative ABC transport system permease protein
MRLDLTLDGRVLTFTLLLSLLTTLACGLVPAWRGSRDGGRAGLKGVNQGIGGRRRPFGLVAQIVLSFALLLIAGSVIEAFRRLQTTDPGFAVEGRVYAYVLFPGGQGPEERRLVYAQALDRLRTVPGVVSASQTSVLPLMPSGTECAAVPGGSSLRASAVGVDRGYFQTMGIAFKGGRDFTPSDDAPDAASIIVAEALGARLWPHTSPIGQHVALGCENVALATVVGVVADAAVQDVGESPRPRIYRPLAREESGALAALLVHTNTDASAMVPTVRGALFGIGRNLRVYTVQTFRDYVEQSLTSVRWMALLLSGFGLVALVLAAVGLYGVIAYRVSLQTQEIGIRMALGASRGTIFREVIRYGMIVSVAGILIGELLGIPATRALAAMQAGVRVGSPVAHVAVTVLWVIVAVAACWVPAYRAARVDPIDALRHE